MLVSSIKTLVELYTVPPHWWPDTPTLRQLHQVYRVRLPRTIPRYFLNSGDHLGRLFDRFWR